MKTATIFLSVLMLLPAASFAQNSESSNDYAEITEWWINYYDDDKEAAYEVLDQMADKIREEFPMDPQIENQIEAIKEEYDKREEDLLKDAGITYSEMKSLDPEDPLFVQIESIWSEENEKIKMARQDYDAAFHERYYTACREAMLRLQENAEAMKNR